LFFIYGTGYSSVETEKFYAVKLGDFPAGQTSSFSVLVTGTQGEDIWWYEGDNYFSWYIAGLYGDVSGGQYSEGINGVTLGTDNISEGDEWVWINPLDEQSVFIHLFNDEPENIPPYSSFGSIGKYECWNCNLEISATTPLFNFSSASNNGEMHIETEVIPEPVTVLLVGAGGAYVLRRRRRED